MEKISGEQVMLYLNAEGGEKDKNKTLLVPKKCTIADLYKRTRKHLGNIGENVGMALYVGGEVLDEASQETMVSYGIDNGTSLTTVLLAYGGSKCLSPLPGHILVTDEPCCVMGDADPLVKQAKMPCGCVVGIETMKEHCTTLVKDSRFLFTCPSCRKSWKYFLVRHVLSVAMTDDELESFNRKVSANLINSCIKIQKCPGCNIFLQRDSSKEFSNQNWVQCPACSARNGKRFEFCWICLNPWKGDRNSCGNVQCTGKDRRIQILETCKTKVIDLTSDVPNTRGCARCGTLIEHKDKCKHMNCPKCHYEFCFVCLKPRTNIGWQCGAFDSKCNVAPRQINLFDIDTDDVAEGSRPSVNVARPLENGFRWLGLGMGLGRRRSAVATRPRGSVVAPRSRHSVVAPRPSRSDAAVSGHGRLSDRDLGAGI